MSPYICNVCCPMDTLRCIPYSECRHFCSSSGHATSSLVIMRTTLSWSPLTWETLSQRAGRNGEVCFFLTSGSWCITTTASDENTFPRNRNNNKFPQGRRVSTFWFLSLFKAWSERILIFMLCKNFCVEDFRIYREGCIYYEIKNMFCIHRKNGTYSK